MESIEEQLQLRDRVRRRMFRMLTPEPRMAKSDQLQVQCMRELQSNPEAYRRFIRRNLAKRAVSPEDNPASPSASSSVTE